MNSIDERNIIEEHMQEPQITCAENLFTFVDNIYQQVQEKKLLYFLINMVALNS